MFLGGRLSDCARYKLADTTGPDSEQSRMAVDIKVTPAGESITHATLQKWLRPDGSAVKTGEPVCELETDKATKEEYAPANGVLSIQVQPGVRVPIGAVIGSIDPNGTPRAAEDKTAGGKAPPASAATDNRRTDGPP